MKRILSLVLAAVMMTAALTGCGCMDRNVSNDTGGMITEETTIMPRPTATHATEPHATTLPPMTTNPMDEGTDTTATTDMTIDPKARNQARNRTR